ncbi:TPA: hypothetical protein ACX6SG_003029 [Photobacterium damselae]
MKSNFCRFFYWVLCIFLIVLPIIFYALKFGVGLWGNPNDWGSLGSYLSGIYSPILTAGTLFLLWKQFQRQKEIEDENKQLVIARRHFDLLSGVFTRLKEMENEARDKFDNYDDLEGFNGFETFSVKNMFDIYCCWAEGSVVKIKDPGYMPITVAGKSRVVSSFKLYFKCLDELKKNSNNQEIVGLYEQAKLFGLTYYTEELYLLMDTDENHFKKNK